MKTEMIEVKMSLTKDGRKSMATSKLDPSYVDAIGIETIAARIADGLWCKLTTPKEA